MVGFSYGVVAIWLGLSVPRSGFSSSISRLHAKEYLGSTVPRISYEKITKWLEVIVPRSALLYFT